MDHLDRLKRQRLNLGRPPYRWHLNRDRYLTLICAFVKIVLNKHKRLQPIFDWDLWNHDVTYQRQLIHVVSIWQ